MDLGQLVAWKLVQVVWSGFLSTQSWYWGGVTDMWNRVQDIPQWFNGLPLFWQLVGVGAYLSLGLYIGLQEEHEHPSPNRLLTASRVLLYTFGGGLLMALVLGIAFFMLSLSVIYGFGMMALVVAGSAGLCLAIFELLLRLLGMLLGSKPQP